jgi:hypothetical protein
MTGDTPFMVMLTVPAAAIATSTRYNDYAPAFFSSGYEPCHAIVDEFIR